MVEYKILFDKKFYKLKQLSYMLYKSWFIDTYLNFNVKSNKTFLMNT